MNGVKHAVDVGTGPGVLSLVRKSRSHTHIQRVCEEGCARWEKKKKVQGGAVVIGDLLCICWCSHAIDFAS